MTIDLYSARLSPPCRAVLMTAKELNIDLNVKTVDLAEGQQMTPEFLKLNPAHTVPTLDDDGFILWESRAIIQYLCNQYAPDSPLYPKDPKKRAVVDRFLNFDMTLVSSLREALFLKMFAGIEPPEDKVTALKNNLKLLDQLIGDNKYVTGNDLTIADLSLLATSVLPNIQKYDFTDYPNYKRWYSTLSSQLSYFDEVNQFEPEYIRGYVEKVKARLAKAKAN